MLNPDSRGLHLLLKIFARLPVVLSVKSSLLGTAGLQALAPWARDSLGGVYLAAHR